MGKKIIIDKDDLIKLYIEQNNSIEEMASLLNCSVITLYRNLNKFNIKKMSHFVQEQRINTNIKKYGVSNPLQNIEIKNKIKQTNLEKYGVDNPAKSSLIKNKTKKTNIERYGFESHLKNKNIIAKIKQTNLEKYGVDNPFKSEMVKSKIKKTQQESGLISDLFGKTIMEWTRQYGLPQVNLYKWIKNNSNYTKDDLINYLENYQIKLTDIENQVLLNVNECERWNKFVLGLSYKPDFKITDNLYLNVDGLYFHSDLKLEKEYHFNIRKAFEDDGKKIIQFRSDEVFNKIKIIKSVINDILNNSESKLNVKKTQIREVKSKEAKSFLEQNHIKGYKSAKHFGLYYNNEIVSLLSYKLWHNKKNKSNFIKIERYCSKIDTNVIGGFSKLLKAIKLPNYSIHYWIDLRYETDDFLLNHGFKLEKETLGWEWTDFKATYNRLKCRANMDERNLTEKEYAAELKWYKIYDAGQRLYVKC